MTSELAMKSKEIESQVANHIRNLQMELESYQQRLKEEQDIARRATAQGDRSENAEWQIANDAIARINVSIMSLSDTIATYKKFSTSYIPTGKATLYIKIYPTGLGNAKIGAISAATPLGAAVLGKSKGAEVTVKAPLGYIPYYIEEVL